LVRWYQQAADWLRGRDRVEHALSAEIERAIARYRPGMERPDYARIRETGSVDLRDVAAVRRWRRRGVPCLSSARIY
jgi:hypothetical protein